LTPSLRNRFLLVLAAILFSTGGAAIKAATLTAWQVVCFRSLVAGLAILLLLPEARRSWRWRTAGVSLAYAATLILFVLANRLTTAANAIFLQSAAPLYLLLFSPWLLKEPIRRADVLYMLAVAAGLSLFFVQTESAVATAPNPGRGNLLAAASGISYALTLAGLRWLARGKETNAGIATVAIGNLVVFMVALPMALPVAAPGAANIAVVLYMGIFQVGLSYVCVTKALRHVPAFEANTVLLLEPALNPVWVWLLHGEKPGAWALAGGTVIIGAALVNALRLRP
jgi:drug/metabolite transporter, DME family